MPDEFVAIDLETTGLDRSSDRITEVGATRFNLSGEAESFQSLVDPGIPIPTMIEDLTGITNADVRGAPAITGVAAELAAFCGSRPVIGQNIAFDTEFLRAVGTELAGPPLDTLDLGSILLPTAAHLDLASMAELLGVDAGTHHRALSDAETTRDVFLRLLTMLERLPRATLLDMLAFAERANWPLAMVFADALERSSDGGDDVAERLGSGSLSLPQLPPPAPALLSHEVPRSVPAADVTRLFERAVERPIVEGFEPRPGQLQMAQVVAQTIASNAHLAVEAGTGTGKSLAYLLPSLLHAYRNDDRIVISTHTLNLQEQLAGSDIPAAAALIEEMEGVERGSIRAVMLKGRSNYLCLERYAELRETQRELTIAEARLLSRLAVWLPFTESGDQAELYMPFDDRGPWSELTADSNDCLTRQCAYVRDGSCFLVRARQAAAAAHAVVVNHALLLTASAGATQALPPYRHLVIDEAHRLEEVATDQYGAMLSLRDLEAMLTEMSAAAGTVGRLRNAATDGSPLSPAAGLLAVADSITAAATSTRERIAPLTSILRMYAEDRRESGTSDGPGGELMLTSARQSQPLWADVEETAMQLDVTLLNLEDRLRQAADAASTLGGAESPGVDRIGSDLGREAEMIHRTRETLIDVALKSDPQQIVWMRVDEHDVRVNIAPLDVSGQLVDDLYAGCESVVATSATLTTGTSFDFAVERLGLVEPDTLQVPSPFNFRKSVLAIVPTDIPEPTATGYETSMHRALGDAARAAGGRTLALFTSRRAVRAAASALRDQLATDGITVLAQGVDGSPARLLRSLAERPRALILGTAAFWEGVDVRGQALSQIVIVRLPFPVPTDPIYAARAEQYDDPFGEYAIPRAVLRFRQGFGRLIRGTDERGVFIVLDSRIASRRYGEAFLDALPDCEVRQLTGAAVGDAVAAWLS